jgi:cytochrome P450
MTTSLPLVPDELVVDFDIYDPRLAAPVDVLQDRVAALRATSPVVWSTAYGGHWVVTGYDEVHQVLRDHETFSSWPNNLVLKDAGMPMIPLEFDPPEHTAFRQVIQPLFNPARMRALEEEIRTEVSTLIDGFARRGEAEYVAEFAHELPARVFCRLMGWPLEDAPMFTETTDVILVGKPDGTDEESAIARFGALAKLMTYFGGIVAQRRAAPDDADITSRIISTPVQLQGESRAITDEELCSMFFLLLMGGFHTVQGSLAWSLMHLAADPGQRDRLVQDQSRIPEAVEEILRLEAAVSMGRRVTKDTELAGLQLRAGDQLLCILSAANRDDREFSAADELNVERSPNRHLSFGSGVHRCVGSHLARIELRIALEEIHRRIPDYRIDTSRPLVCHSSQVRGVLELPIRFTPEPA